MVLVRPLASAARLYFLQHLGVMFEAWPPALQIQSCLQNVALFHPVDEGNGGHCEVDNTRFDFPWQFISLRQNLSDLSIDSLHRVGTYRATVLSFIRSVLSAYVASRTIGLNRHREYRAGTKTRTLT